MLKNLNISLDTFCISAFFCLIWLHNPDSLFKIAFHFIYYWIILNLHIFLVYSIVIQLLYMLKITMISCYTLSLLKLLLAVPFTVFSMMHIASWSILFLTVCVSILFTSGNRKFVLCLHVSVFLFILFCFVGSLFWF